MRCLPHECHSLGGPWIVWRAGCSREHPGLCMICFAMLLRSPVYRLRLLGCLLQGLCCYCRSADPWEFVCFAVSAGIISLSIETPRFVCFEDSAKGCISLAWPSAYRWKLTGEVCCADSAEIVCLQIHGSLSASRFLLRSSVYRLRLLGWSASRTWRTQWQSPAHLGTSGLCPRQLREGRRKLLRQRRRGSSSRTHCPAQGWAV